MNLHLHRLVLCSSVVEDGCQFQRVISEHHSAEVPQHSGGELKACSLALLLPELAIRVEDPISKEDIESFVEQNSLQSTSLNIS